jgi:DNA-binding GntR family transcriptional regulator
MEHLEMIEAICSRDEDKAEKLMRHHMRLGRIKFIKELEKEGQPIQLKNIKNKKEGL